MESLSVIETAILMALEGNHRVERNLGEKRIKGEGVLVNRDQGDLLKIEDMTPKNMILLPDDENRIYSIGSEYLLNHPSDIVPDTAEVCHLHPDGRFLWSGIRQIKKPPKGLCVLGVASHFFELHSRLVFLSGRGVYQKRIIPVNKDGMPLIAKIQNHDICDKSLGEFFCVRLSIIEDSKRINSLLATIVSERTLNLSLDLSEYKSLFRLRDAPLTESMKRKAIIHWVSKHIRKSRNRSSSHSVIGHLRGVQEITMGGLKIILTPIIQQEPTQ